MNNKYRIAAIQLKVRVMINPERYTKIETELDRITIWSGKLSYVFVISMAYIFISEFLRFIENQGCRTAIVKVKRPKSRRGWAKSVANNLPLALSVLVAGYFT
jgi:hypothetical protein